MSSSIHRLKLLNQALPSSNFPSPSKDFLTNLLLASPGVHLRLTPINYAQFCLSALEVHVHPVHPLATPCCQSKFYAANITLFCSCDLDINHGRLPGYGIDPHSLNIHRQTKNELSTSRLFSTVIVLHYRQTYIDKLTENITTGFAGC